MNGNIGKLLLGPILCAGLFPAAALSAQTSQSRVAQPATPAQREARVRPAPSARPAPETRREAPEGRRPNGRLDDERARIRRGVQSGELTRQEVTRLKNELETLKAHQKRALTDGTLTPQEKERLQNEIQRLDRAIYQQTHDNQDQERN